MSAVVKASLQLKTNKKKSKKKKLNRLRQPTLFSSSTANL